MTDKVWGIELLEGELRIFDVSREQDRAKVNNTTTKYP